MKILITGASGFSAGYLISELSQKKDARLVCVDACQKNAKDWHRCDLSIFNHVYLLIKRIKPDKIYHLAGSFTNVYESDYRNNVLSTKNIFDAVIKLGLKCRILLVGSCAEYGMAGVSGRPVKEDSHLNPISIYGLTKAYQANLMRFYFLTGGVDAVMARTFNLFGIGMSNKLFVGRLYEQISVYKKGRISKIAVGNLDNKRDYIDVKEAVKYYELIMEHGASGEIYNVGSGRSKKTRDLLKAILKENNLSMSAVCEKTAPASGKIDVSDMRADISRILKLKNHVRDMRKSQFK